MSSCISKNSMLWKRLNSLKLRVRTWNGWLKYYRILLGPGLFSGAVSSREGITNGSFVPQKSLLSKPTFIKQVTKSIYCIGIFNQQFVESISANSIEINFQICQAVQSKMNDSLPSPKTNSSPLKRGHPKKETSMSTIINHPFFRWYCWWKKSCTTWDV